jgi:hypothetical protein
MTDIAKQIQRCVAQNLLVAETANSNEQATQGLPPESFLIPKEAQ